MSVFRKYTDKLQDSKSIKTLYVLMGLTAVIGIISGIGSSCTIFDQRWWKIDSFAVIEDFQIVFLTTYFVTWFVALLWIVLYWALGTKKSLFYNVAIVNSILGFFSGIILPKKWKIEIPYVSDFFLKINDIDRINRC